ncbi:helix-turn-helix domain-containing protein [Leucobacter sp. NPDC015123]|uniref:helix-turn-helix domain-containing protein n=1 Tax=Leucobacter sp. NPDC015123 TaxID=3364129 RepID=UPI0036F489BC
MRELAGRLSALDAAASESLKVIEYFDALVDGRASAEGMLRGAAALSGVVVGRERHTGESRRYFPDGAVKRGGEPAKWPSRRVSDGGTVWLERPTASFVNDAMILERLAISLAVCSQRLDTAAPTRRAVELLISGDGSAEELDEALARLAIPARSEVFAVAAPPTEPLAQARGLPHAMIATRFGVLRAVLAGSSEPIAGRIGIGLPALTSREIRDSWRTAIIALRLTCSDVPIVKASELGSLLLLAEQADKEPQPHHDSVAVGSALAAGWTPTQLRQVSAGVSRRALARMLEIHHSSVERRLDKLTEVLGFDATSEQGRLRLGAAIMLHRLSEYLPD